MKKNYPVTNVEKEYSEDIRIITTTDLKGIITHANDGFVEVSGFPREELEGKNHNVVRHPDMPPAAFEDMWETLKAGKQWMGIVKNRCKNGDHYWVNAHVTPIYNHGKVTGYQSVRVVPRREWVRRAEQVYQRLNVGKKPFSWATQLACLGRRTGKYLLILLPLLIAGGIVGQLSWPSLLGTAVLGVPVAGLLAWVEGRILRKRATLATEVFDNPLMQWIYTGRLSGVGAYELGLITQQAMLRTILGTVEDSAVDLGDLANDNTSVVEQTRQGVQRQCDEIDQVATAMNEMAATVQEVAQNTQSAMNAANEATEQARAGALTVTEAIGVIENLSESVKQAQQVIQKLSEDSTSIGSVLEVITGIAEQTNLLALNAAIEAARAGEQGRGFAVVADEVRTLAQRTQDSTREIHTIVERIQGGVQHVVNEMGEVTEKAEHGVAQVEESAMALSEISGAVTSINDMNTQIASSAEEQSAVAEEINRNIININQVSQETAEGAKVTAESSQRLSEMVMELRSMVHQFSK
ncbi:MAG: PAS domain-containing methyl-accepting chemotaxis protein [Thiohalophilus sp.]|uniref:methyl-accepting chemotaxis protein n=1 Tax=Thiohalophilus sp. TaxID=3028392 RepID=UPI00287042E4|nr:PAS domain-containing methyl-accepting chemotaxis protein [Thiohalophilus sp.]MDR9436671.1 PAS domain-containing methyl-accepting chemotaxis protein [Thiohalophilus sp.]